MVISTEYCKICTLFRPKKSSDSGFRSRTPNHYIITRYPTLGKACLFREATRITKFLRQWDLYTGTNRIFIRTAVTSSKQQQLHHRILSHFTPCEHRNPGSSLFLPKALFLYPRILFIEAHISMMTTYELKVVFFTISYKIFPFNSIFQAKYSRKICRITQ